MYDWCHSGLEGYCKSAALMLVDQFEGEEEAGEQDGHGRRGENRAMGKFGGDDLLHLCQDLLPDRTEENLTRAWTLSNVRQGRSCRQTLFEKCWLGDTLWKAYLDEIKLLTRGVEPEGGYVTIPPSSDYARELQTCLNIEERLRVAVRRREVDALDACVKRIIGLLEDDENDEAASVVSLVMKHDFPVEFFGGVVPAIERGLLSERYRSSDIQQFILTLNAFIYPAHRCLVQGKEGVGHEPFRRFLTTLFSGLVYGPTHPYATSRTWDATPGYDPIPFEVDDAFVGTTLRLTQVFDDLGRYSGYSELFRPSEVVFFGRSPDVDRYRECCRELFAEDPELLGALEGCEAVVFPIVRHAAVSNVHGMLLCEGDVWRLFDLGSTNGTSIVSEDSATTVERLSEVRPGDRLRLGAPARADDANVYLEAATVLVSLHVDLSEELI